MDIEAILAQLADNDEAARAAYRAAQAAFKYVPVTTRTYRAKHVATQLLGVEDGFAVYAAVKF